MIGLIFTKKKLKKIVAGKKTFYDDLDFYAKLARKYQIDLCMYSVNKITDQSNMVKGYVFAHKDDTLTKKKVPIPQVNLFRTGAYLRKTSTIRLLRNLAAESGIIFINMVTQKERNKYHIYRYLNKIQEIRGHIPETAELSYANLKHFLQTYDQVIIKPVRGSLGKNITTIDKRTNDYVVHRTRSKKTSRKIVPKEVFQEFYAKMYKKPQRYLVQPCLPLKEYKGKKFDIRVSTQKNKNRQWQVTGMVMRLAKSKGIVTNLAQGGVPVAFNDVFPGNKKIKKEIRRLSLEIASALVELYPTIADMGLDIAVDKDGQLWFLEANFCALKKSYRRLKDRKTRAALYRIPFEYAYAVYAKEKGGNDRDRIPV